MHGPGCFTWDKATFDLKGATDVRTLHEQRRVQVMAANATWLSKPPGTCPWHSTPVEYQAKKQSPGQKLKKVDEQEEKDEAGWWA